MSQVTASRNVVVTNPAGLHLRAAMPIAKLARQFDAKIEIVRGRERFDAAEILQIISVGADAGMELTLEATGHDAQRALDAMAELFQNNCGEPVEP
jgi:phosphocarrier protein